MGAMTKEALHQYKEKLEQGILEYMRMPPGERSASGVRGMLECWTMVDAAEQSMCDGSASEMTKADAEAWVSHMANEDGSTGQHCPWSRPRPWRRAWACLGTILPRGAGGSP